jgi:hypothetical protein
MLICARLSIWKTPIVSALQIIAKVAGRPPASRAIEAEMLALVPGEQVERAAHAAEHAEAEHVDLHEAQFRRYRPCPIR